MLPALVFISLVQRHRIWFNLWGSERIVHEERLSSIKNNWFDRLFIAVITFIGINSFGCDL